MAKYEKQQEKQSVLTMDVEDLFKKKNNSVKRSRKGMVTESKNTMNFVRYESAFNFKKALPVILVVILAALLIAQYGFLEPLAAKRDMYNQLAQKQEELAQVNLQLEGYEELSDKYARYSYGLMSDAEINLVDRMDVLALVEKEIATKAIIDNFAVNSNVLTMNIYGITLEGPVPSSTVWRAQSWSPMPASTPPALQTIWRPGSSSASRWQK